MELSAQDILDSLRNKEIAYPNNANVQSVKYGKTKSASLFINGVKVTVEEARKMGYNVVEKKNGSIVVSIEREGKQFVWLHKPLSDSKLTEAADTVPKNSDNVQEEIDDL